MRALKKDFVGDVTAINRPPSAIRDPHPSYKMRARQWFTSPTALCVCPLRPQFELLFHSMRTSLMHSGRWAFSV